MSNESGNRARQSKDSNEDWVNTIDRNHQNTERLNRQSIALKSNKRLITGLYLFVVIIFLLLLFILYKLLFPYVKDVNYFDGL